MLIEEGFLASVAVVGEGSRKQLRIGAQVRRAAPAGHHRHLKRVSRPSLRVYVGGEEIPLVRGGLGINVLSTPAACWSIARRGSAASAASCSARCGEGAMSRIGTPIPVPAGVTVKVPTAT